MKKHIEECITVASLFGNDMVLGKNRDRNYNPNLKVVRELTGYGVELCYVIDQDTDWTEGMNSEGIGLVNTALFVKRDEKDFDKSKKKKAMSKDGVRIREALAKTTLHDVVKSLVSYHGGIKGHTFVGDGRKLVVIENTSRVKPIVKIKDLSKEPIVRTNHGIEHPEQGYQDGNDKLSSELRLMNALNVLHQTPHYKELFPAFYNHKQDKGPKYDLVRAQNKLWTSSQLLMNLNKREMILYLVPGAVTFLGIENRLPNDYDSKLSFIVKEYEHTPEEKYKQFVPTTKKPKYSALVGELIEPFLGKKQLNEAGEQYYWPRTILPKIKGSGYDSLKRAKSTIRSIKTKSKSEQKEIVETMYNRAKYHDSQTGGMREAMEVFEQWLTEDTKKIKKVIGIYGGRYQPFGPHHKKTYEWLKKQVDVAYITTSNIKTPPKHPFNFKEKVRHMTKMGIPRNRIINETSPLIAKNVLNKYDSDTTAVIYIFGEKDAGRLAGGRKKSGGLAYFQDYKKNKNDIKGYEEHGYFMTAPHVSVKVGGKEVSGTVMRNLLDPNTKPKPTPKLFKDAFGYYDEGIFMMMVNKFGKLSEEGITEATGGKLIAARNKGHLRNGGETALDAQGIISKFKGRGDISDAFSFAVKDLEKAIGKLSDKQRNKIFMNGKAWMNLEVMWPKSANVINYDKAEIVFHGALEYDDNGTAVGEVKGSGRMLAGMIKQVNQNIQKHYKIGKPNFLTVPKHQDFDKKKQYFVNKLSKLQREYKLKDNDTLALYHQRFWEDFVKQGEGQYTSGIPNKVEKKLVKRWAFFDKSYKIATIKKDLEKFPAFLEWVLGVDKQDHAAIVKANMKPFETLFFELGAEIMKNVSGWLAASPDSTVQRVKKQLDSAISNVRSGGDLKKLNTLKLQLDKLKSIGGLDSVVPSEGIVFKYNGKTYKFTGAFAPINQITGLMTF
ncbi:cytidylyltransferase like protein [uncultured Mediterranean phage]|nr:cytidylyltransferase like protein [uncultured Mediterranean phage]